MALESDYDTDWDKCGCFETFASGNGIGYQASKLYGREVTSYEVFDGYAKGDEKAVKDGASHLRIGKKNKSK